MQSPDKAGDSRANVPCFNILHCALSAGKMCDIIYTNANMAVLSKT